MQYIDTSTEGRVFKSQINNLQNIPDNSQVWVQGFVEEILGSSINIKDATGSVVVLVSVNSATKPGFQVAGLQRGDYVLISGKLVHRQPYSRIKALKFLNLTSLSQSPEEVAERAELWKYEVEDAQRACQLIHNTRQQQQQR
jgi:aspartyl/asparaginyl-tRNA synthetase